MRYKRIKGIFCAFASWINLIENVYAQTAPGFTFGQVPTASQWNGYFSGKVDYPGIFGTGNTWTGSQTFNQSFNLGITGVVTGSAALNGPSSGSILFQAQPNAGTWTWIFPTTVGAQGTVLQSQGTAAGLAWGQVPYSQLVGFAQNVNLNAIADTSIALTLPTTNYVMEGVWVENTGTLSSLATGSFSLCTLSGAGGTCVFPVSTSMVGISSAGINNVNNGLVAVDDNSYWNLTTWFFRVTHAAGNGALGTVIITVHPLPIGLP